jgi:hypothetical protein
MSRGFLLRAVLPVMFSSTMLLAMPSVGAAQTDGTFKLAYYNIKSGRGQVGLTGVSTFSDTGNCTDRARPLNAWGTGLVQQHLLASIRNDPAVVALGLGEAWACGSPENVRQVLGWKARSSERNGVAMVAKHGFAGPEEWVQLDTSLTDNPADTKWVLRRDVCLDAGCSQSIPVFVAHWWGSTGPGALATYDRQALQTVEFLERRGGAVPHVLIGDLNVWEAAGPVCSQQPNGASLALLRSAGYVDAWYLLHGRAEGFTGMLNRRGCGSPAGYAWKRIDYAWSPGWFLPLSMTRFGVVTPGVEAPSDHYGIVVEFAMPEGWVARDPSYGSPSPVPGGCLTPDPFTAIGGGTCINGGWIPGQVSTTSGASGVPASPPPPAACTIPDPFTAIGGGTCVNGGWIPGQVNTTSGTGGVPASAPPAAACTIPDPFTAIGGGTCVNGGWIPGQVNTTFGAPASAPPAAACTTPDPFTAIGGGICRNGGWTPRGGS